MKNRILVLLTVVALVVVMLAPVALAITKQCSASPCYGTRNDDELREHPRFNAVNNTRMRFFMRYPLPVEGRGHFVRHR